jgi:hypothetical protein
MSADSNKREPSGGKAAERLREFRRQRGLPEIPEGEPVAEETTPPPKTPESEVPESSEEK